MGFDVSKVSVVVSQYLVDEKKINRFLRETGARLAEFYQQGATPNLGVTQFDASYLISEKIRKFIAKSIATVLKDCPIPLRVRVDVPRFPGDIETYGDWKIYRDDMPSWPLRGRYLPVRFKYKGRYEGVAVQVLLPPDQREPELEEIAGRYPHLTIYCDTVQQAEKVADVEFLGPQLLAMLTRLDPGDDPNWMRSFDNERPQDWWREKDFYYGQMKKQGDETDLTNSLWLDRASVNVDKMNWLLTGDPWLTTDPYDPTTIGDRYMHQSSESRDLNTSRWFAHMLNMSRNTQPTPAYLPLARKMLTRVAQLREEHLLAYRYNLLNNLNYLSYRIAGPGKI